MLKILQARFQQYVNREHVVVQAGFSKGRITRDQIANIHWIIEKAKEFQENICLIDHTKIIPFFVWITTNGEKFFKRWECQITLPASWETCVQVKKHRDRCGTMDWFKIRQKVNQCCVFHPAYLTYMQSTSCEMLGWMNHKLEDCREIAGRNQ